MTTQLGALALFRPTNRLAPGDDGPWETRAACRTVNPELFFYDTPNGVREAKKVCDGCTVKIQCLDAALAEEGTLHAPSRFGVRGGLTPDERYTLTKRGRARA